MLVHSDRHRADDLRLWREYADADRIYGERERMQRLTMLAQDEIRRFAQVPCYCSVSWGKDSVVVADLTLRTNPRTPLVWVRVEPICNPDCLAVRDAFLQVHDCEYHEIEVWCERDKQGWHATGTLEAGFRHAVNTLRTVRHVSGLRADESGPRKISMRKDGLATKNSCRPLAWWTVADVFGYLAVHDLPVHPVYAMLGGGRWQREHIRVASLGGKRGDQFGRTVWETEYYGDVLRRLEAR